MACVIIILSNNYSARKHTCFIFARVNSFADEMLESIIKATFLRLVFISVDTCSRLMEKSLLSL